jgi:hypothetical protein
MLRLPRCKVTTQDDIFPEIESGALVVVVGDDHHPRPARAAFDEPAVPGLAGQHVLLGAGGDLLRGEPPEALGCRRPLVGGRLLSI